jgi:membrane protein DedA with SNARE-associated domain
MPDSGDKGTVSMSMARGVFDYIWARFLWLTWTGRLISIAVTIYALGWAFGTLGAHHAARQFGSVALYVLAFPLTWLFIRLVWKMSKKPRN